MVRVLWIISTLLLYTVDLHAQSIEEKKMGIEQFDDELDKNTRKELILVNKSLQLDHQRLNDLYAQVEQLFQEGAEQSAYRDLLKEIQTITNAIHLVQEQWREVALGSLEQDSYGLWHQPETTVGQLIIDYGSQDYVYMIPPEIAEKKLTISSHMPIPRESWGAMLEMILAQSGVGIQQLNPYLRRLFLIEHGGIALKFLTNRPEDLNLIPGDALVGYLLSTGAFDPTQTLQFLERFSSQSTMQMDVIGHDIVIIASAQQVKEVLKVYDFVRSKKRGREYKMLALRKIDVKDAQEMIYALFFNSSVKEKGKKGVRSTLQILPLKSLKALFICGSKEEIKRATDVLEDLESQVEDSHEKVVHWYNCKHTEAEDLADVLAQVYALMSQSKFDTGEGGDSVRSDPSDTQSQMVVSPGMVSMNEKKGQKQKVRKDNFIVDVKTGAIIMVVEKESLGSLKRVIQKIDIPKKMVRIDILLFEKRVIDSNRFGLNLLKLGADASGITKTGLSFQGVSSGGKSKGILDFSLARPKRGIMPAYELAYNFLISQEDIQVNANPSIVTVNQTPAAIDLVDEISINTGVVEISAGNNDLFAKNAFERKQYGIHINITPTVHAAVGEGDDLSQFITLKTDIVFDTTKSDKDNRPQVFRRHINNEVRIADGQTVILGGLRQKDLKDTSESVPFLGEIPGFGKFFSNTEMTDTSTEMFILLTPRVIHDSVNDLDALKQADLTKRPGDYPEFLERLQEAKEHERSRLFESGIKMLFGRLETSQRPSL